MVLRVRDGCACVFCEGERVDKDEVLREEYTLAWDGEPKMGGGNHRHSTGSWRTMEDAQRALDNYPSAQRHPERNYRIEVRRTTPWRLA